MGRDNAIPNKFFGSVNPVTQIPSNNIILVGILTYVDIFIEDIESRNPHLEFIVFTQYTPD